jgi:hypothetical protein
VFAAELDDMRDFVGRLRERDGVGQRMRVRRFVLAVMLTHRVGRAETVAKQRAQRVQQR